MSSNQSESEIRALSADEIDATSGAMKPIHIHVPGLFHLALSDHGASIGAFGYGVGVDDEDGAFTFTFN
jgi:hypothetical protein